MKIKIIILLMLGFTLDATVYAGPQFPGYRASGICKECHEKFYQLWSTSWHGKAARPYTSELAEKEFVPQKEDVIVGKYRYRVESGRMIEAGPRGNKRYPIEHVIGGKGTYNFLTTLPNGRVQALPLGYDGDKKEWFDAISGSVSGTGKEDGHVDWKAKPKGFYTACPSCHVSQYSPTYEISTAAYSATWTEPGVNCESCHGPSAEHIRIARKAPKGQPLSEPGLFRPKTMTAEQRNDLCNICHGHVKPLDASFMPGDRFFDHFDLATLEIDAFYPDGRGRGETFTMTQWLMSPCAKSAKLDCMHCHTSSGRYRFGDADKANNACLPCHADRVKNATAHTHHKADSPGNRCISCHMAPTYYARMKQSDHSMLPPTPAATIAFGSPNACNTCHSDKDTRWAEQHVRAWHKDGYQAPVLRRAQLIVEAKKGDWRNLPEMLKYIRNRDRNEVFAASLIRCMFINKDEKILPVLLDAMKDTSPLVRGAAAQALRFRPSAEARDALVRAANDDYRVVRISAAYGLTSYAFEKIGQGNDADIKRAVDDLLASLMMHPDVATSHEVSGNIYQKRGMFKEAAAAFENALRIEPGSLMTLINLSVAYDRIGENRKAERTLAQALKIAPDNQYARAVVTKLTSTDGIKSNKAGGLK